MTLKQLQARTKDWSLGYPVSFEEYAPIQKYQGKGKVHWIPSHEIYERVMGEQKYKTTEAGRWEFMLTEENGTK